jgi:peptidoglycan/xylan/chitin deacetylase (PgdA/CDA1 family)
MRVLSPFLKRVLYPALSSVGFPRYFAREGRLCVVTYHGVRPTGYVPVDPALDGGLVTAESFRLQIRWLKSQFTIVSPDDVRQSLTEERRLTPRAVLLTCDDGLANVVTEMIPILKSEEVSCLFFITAASATNLASMLWYEELYLMFLSAKSSTVHLDNLELGEKVIERSSMRQSWWRIVQALSRLEEKTRRDVLDKIRDACGLPENWSTHYSMDGPHRERFFRLTADGLKTLLAAHMTIGAHSLSHPVLPQMADAFAWAEVEQSARLIEAAIGTSIWAFAYPFGDQISVTDREIKMAEKAGYECAFVNFDGGFGSKIERFSIPRVHVTADMGLGEFAAHVCGFHNAMRRWIGR